MRQTKIICTIGPACNNKETILKMIDAGMDDNPYLEQCRIISNSDAHYLEHINEANLTIQVEERSAEAVVRALL